MNWAIILCFIVFAGFYIHPARGVGEEWGAAGEPWKNTKITLEYELDRLNPVALVAHPQIEYYTVRLEKPFKLSERWELATRFDFVWARSNFPSRDNPNHDYEGGYSDSLAEWRLVYSACNRWSLTAGLRTWWPTATQDQLGSGKIQMVPVIGLLYNLPEISKGSNFAPLVRYAADVGGYGGRGPVSQFQIKPTLNLELPRGFTVTLFPSGDIIVNLADHNKCFLPFDAMISKTVFKNTVLYAEVSIPMIREFCYYDFKFLTGLSVTF